MDELNQAQTAMDDEAMVQEWWSEIDAADRVAQPWRKWWEANLEAYAPKPTTDPKKYGEDINTNRDFTLVEQKRAQLFFQTPEVSVKPSPLMEGQGDVLLTHQHIINEILGPDRVDAISMIDRTLFDLLCPAGMGVTKMGYESVTQTVMQAVPVPDPMTGAPAVDPMTGQPMTVEQPVPVPIFERLYWEQVSPLKLVVPADWHSTEFDKAPWVGMRFSMTLAEAKQRYQLPDDFESSGGSCGATLHFEHGAASDEAKKPVEGVEIWYRAALKDPNVLHPERIRLLVLIKGIDQPIIHRDSPYQDVDPNTGALTPQSMRGYPIHILTTRSMTDSAFVMSDCSMSRPQVNELNKFREQQIRMRDSNIPLRVYNAEIVPPEVGEKLRVGDYGTGLIGMPAEFFAGAENIKEIAKATYPRENFTFEQKQDADISRTHAMDANQAGIQNETARTATELQLVQSNSNVRLDKERAKVLHWYIKGVTKFSCLVQRFLTVEQAAQIVGQQRAQQWAEVMPKVPSSLAFTAAPDSALRLDAAQRRKMGLETYAFLRNDPKVNTDAVLKDVVFPALGLDSRSVAPPPKPEPPKPEPPKVSISIKGDDLNPMVPQYPGVLIMLKATGVDTSQLPQPVSPQPFQPNPGVVKPDMGMDAGGQAPTGNMQGTPFQAPIAPGGRGLANED